MGMVGIACFGSERQYRDGRPLAETLHQRRARDASGCRGFTMQRDLVDADRPRDVPEVLQSQVDEDEAAVLTGRCRGFGNADAADVGDTLKPRGDIDAVAVDVVVRDDHLAQADADAKADPPFDFLGLCRSFVSVLDFGGATHGSRRIGEFDQCSVPGLLDDAAGCLGYTRLDDRLHPVPQLGVGVFLVQAHQAAVASDVHHEHCCEAPFEALRFSHSVLHRASWLGTGSSRSARPAGFDGKANDLVAAFSAADGLQRSGLPATFVLR